MNSTHRPRVIVNGIRRTRTFHFFWCFYCQRAVRTAISNPFQISCPYCSNHLRHELDLSSPRLNLQPSPAARFVDSLAQILDQSSHFSRTTQWQSESEEGPSQASWITLSFTPQSENNRQIGNMLNEINNLEGPGPPPASVSSIQGLAVVRLSETQLADEPFCAICKEEYEVGEEAREMPCKHFYHGDCIAPWLRLHNTCPVCRYELQIQNQNQELGFGFGFGFGFGVGDDVNGEEVRYSLSWWWNQLLALWPFRGFDEWRQRISFDFLHGDHVRGVKRTNLLMGIFCSKLLVVAILALSIALFLLC